MNNEKKQAELLDRYFDMLLQNPSAQPPDGLDAETAEMARHLAGVEHSSLSLTATEKSRIWQETTANQMPIHLNTQRRHNLMFNPKTITRPVIVPTRRFSWLAVVAVISLLILGGLFLSAIQLNDNGIGVEPNNANSGNFGGETATSSPADISSWDGHTRVNILVMGVDNRPGEPWNCRTDTMMIVSLDPTAKTIALLSIPRDAYVEVPDHGLQRINTACVLGELDSPNNGPRLAMQTIQFNLGIPVNEYLVVDFTAFTRLIDQIGGIDINVETSIDDPQYPDMYYGYEPFQLETGLQHLDGATALKYVRTRHGSDDFARQKRQQSVIAALHGQILSTKNIDNLILQAPGIWADLDDNIKTSLKLEQILQLAMLAADVDYASINGYILDMAYMEPYTTEEGSSVLVLERAKAAEFLAGIFGQIDTNTDDPLQVNAGGTPTLTLTPSVTSTSTPTSSVTNTSTPFPTHTASATSTVTPTVDSQSTIDTEMTNTAVAITPTFTPSVTATATPTINATATADAALTSTAASIMATYSADMTATFEEQLEVVDLNYGDTINIAYPVDIADQFYAFEGHQGDIISLATAGDFDTILVLSQPDGLIVASDDDSGEVLNAELYHVQLPVSGSYRVRVQARENTATLQLNNFELSLSQVSPFALQTEVELPISFTPKQTSQVLRLDGNADETISLIFALYTTSSVINVQVMQGDIDLGTLQFLPELYQSTPANEQGAAPSMSRSILIPNDGEVLIYINVAPAENVFIDESGIPQDEVIRVGAIFLRD